MGPEDANARTQRMQLPWHADPARVLRVTIAIRVRRTVWHAALRPVPIAEQNMAMPSIYTDAPRRWTVEEVRTLNAASASERFECVDGELLVTPAPSWDHQEVVGRLYVALTQYLSGSRIGHAFVSPGDVEPEPGALVQPDVFVVPLHDGARPRGRERVERLLLAIEVVSPASAHADRVTKRGLYQRAGTPEYWVVDLDARLVERWRPEDERPEVIAEVLEWLPDGAVEALRVDVGALFAE